MTFRPTLLAQCYRILCIRLSVMAKTRFHLYREKMSPVNLFSCGDCRRRRHCRRIHLWPQHTNRRKRRKMPKNKMEMINHAGSQTVDDCGLCVLCVCVSADKIENVISLARNLANGEGFSACGIASVMSWCRALCTVWLQVFRLLSKRERDNWQLKMFNVTNWEEILFGDLWQRAHRLNDRIKERSSRSILNDFRSFFRLLRSTFWEAGHSQFVSEMDATFSMHEMGWI